MRSVQLAMIDHTYVLIVCRRRGKNCLRGFVFEFRSALGCLTPIVFQFQVEFNSNPLESLLGCLANAFQSSLRCFFLGMLSVCSQYVLGMFSVAKGRGLPALSDYQNPSEAIGYH